MSVINESEENNVCYLENITIIYMYLYAFRSMSLTSQLWGCNTRLPNSVNVVLRLGKLNSLTSPWGGAQKGTWS